MAELVELLNHPDRNTRARAADTLEKLQRELPRASFDRYRVRILNLAERTTEIEARWHFAQMIARLRLTPAQRERAVQILESYFNDRSAIVRTFALDAFVTLAEDDESLRPRAQEHLQRAMRGSAAERARARKLILASQRKNAYSPAPT